MKSSRIFGVIIVLMFIGCSTERKEKELSEPGFGITAIDIKAGKDEIGIPVYLKFNEDVKGIQFILSWDETIAEISQPEMTRTNPNFTVSNNQARDGKMKVLIFSMQGDVMDVTDPHIFDLPIEIINDEASELTVHFEDVVFAGPNASSYEIPVTHAQLAILR